MSHIATFWRDLTALGGAAFYSLVVLFILLAGKQRLALLLVLGFIITMIVVVAIRLLYFKNRPQKQTYHNLLERIDAGSFPSWHTARILFLALVLGESQGRMFMLFALAIALAVAYSRVYLRKHDWWDVGGGVILGLVAYWATTIFL